MSKFAVAILTYGGKYLLMLRDSTKGIPDPGMYGLLAGHIEPGESSMAAVKRIIFDKGNILLRSPRLVGSIIDHDVYHEDIYGQFPIKGQKGQGFGFFSSEELPDLNISEGTRKILSLYPIVSAPEKFLHRKR